jgi:hypothetical protein
LNLVSRPADAPPNTGPVPVYTGNSLPLPVYTGNSLPLPVYTGKSLAGRGPQKRNFPAQKT